MRVLMPALGLVVLLCWRTTSAIPGSKPFAAGSLGDNYSLSYYSDSCHDGSKLVSACAPGGYELGASCVSFYQSGSKLFPAGSPAKYERICSCVSMLRPPYLF